MLDKLLALLGLRTLTDSLVMLHKANPVDLYVDHDGSGLGELEELLNFIVEASRGRIRLRVSESREGFTELPSPRIRIGGALENRIAYYGRLSEPLLPIILEALLIAGGAYTPSCPSSRITEEARLRLYVVTGIPCIIAGVYAVDLLSCWPSVRLEVVNIETSRSLASRVGNVPAFEYKGRIFLRGAPRSLEFLAENIRRVIGHAA